MPDQSKLVTRSQFEAFIERPENSDWLLELINGEIIEKAHSQLSAIITASLTGHLYVYLHPHPIA